MNHVYNNLYLILIHIIKNRKYLSLYSNQLRKSSKKHFIFIISLNILEIKNRIKSTASGAFFHIFFSSVNHISESIM